MHINNDKRAVFYHVMKTGGSSLHNMLESPTELLQRREEAHERWVIVMGMHGSYTQLLNDHPSEYEKIKDYYKFMFVRNPWSHAVSSYFHTTSPERFDKENHMGSNKRRATKDDYKDFNYYLQYLYRPQEQSTFDDPNFMNDEAYFFEDYDNEVKRLFKRFNYSDKAFDSKIKHHNKSSSNIFGVEYPKNYKVMYDQTSIDIIADRCRHYIDKFNYTY
jgi:hypothetical protein